MLTSTAAPASARAARQPRPSYRPFAVTVAGIRRLSDTFTRVTFTGPELHDFGTVGLDQRVKIILPLPGVGISQLPENESWYEAWRKLPDAHRNPIRTYTVRAVRPAAREIDIDFVAHGDTGPASRWVRRAAIGDPLTVVGPDARGENPRSGVEWRPGNARNVLIAGDETAAPAICAILAALPRDSRGSAFIEVPSDGDVMQTGAPEGVEVTWLTRAQANAAASHGSALESAVRSWTTRYITDRHQGAEVADVDIEHDILWDVPESTGKGSDLYAWLAGEASVIKTLRRFLVSETGIDRKQVAFMGYWRHGRAEAN
ncbi:siderophore-interacting protein [Cryobacterium tepidiphilum]|uniref:Siderophore-interacting protein n=1 Tax=Cryobacterium tepidiphilum TaxID=2486026 RepID=A0A3M8LFL3_9MICO|nr:siderophore-interacting protein [Cryobacterium tepidiphilum]RNE63602.1 siderophore-interacting protein [Cryobacterium tepidiphilum]